jgi:cytidylate kinase
VVKSISIAIDGYSSTGKSTMAKALAARLGYRYIDTGAMYRGVTYMAQQKGIITTDIRVKELIGLLDALALDFLHNSDSGQSGLYINNKNVEPFIRKSKVASWVSKVATISEVRRFLVKEQRKMADVGGVVMDGRDIASVVLPKAELKIFMTASPEIRAERRFQELIQKEGSEGLSLEDIAGNLKERDFLDSTREDSPLIQTVDARLLDNSKLTMDQQLDIAHNWVKEYGV